MSKRFSSKCPNVPGCITVLHGVRGFGSVCGEECVEGEDALDMEGVDRGGWEEVVRSRFPLTLTPVNIWH